ncbi:MAG: hypothetical protein K5655_09535 [Lachnospiraceae bacterium]|nr:hypothetical protein [Lachnospiraceae bacterium]
MLVTVTPENRMNFIELAPPEELIRIGADPDYYGIGYTDDENSFPDGVLLFRMESEYDDEHLEHVVADLRFFFVKEESRNMYVGTFLFSKLIEILEDAGAEAIRADVPLGEDYNLVCYVLEKYGFEFSFSENFMFEKKLDDFSGFPIVKASTKNAVYLKEIRQTQLREWVESKGSGEILDEIDISEDIDDYDNDVSTALVVNDTISGLFLIKRDVDGKLCTVILRGDENFGGDGVKALIAKAYKGACEKYPSSTILRVQLHSKQGCALAAFLFPDLEARVTRRGYFYLNKAAAE